MMLRPRASWIFALGRAISVSCAKPSAPTELAQGKPLPASSAQAIGLKAGGTSWTNAEVRAHYLVLVADIGPANAQWKRQGLSAEARAHRAFAIRHDARLTARAMMR